MTVMAEETKEGNVAEFPNRLASPEFFYLLQRIDRVGEKLTDEIKGVNETLTGEIRRVDEKLTGEIKAGDARLSGEIQTMGTTLSKRLDRFEEEFRASRRSSTASVWTGVFGFLAVILTILATTKVL